MKRNTWLALAALAATAPAERALALELAWHANGYLRTRAVWLRNLANVVRDADARPPLERLRENEYLMMRARLEPRLEFEQIAKLQLTLDLFDDVVFGDNDAAAVAPLFATNGTNTDFLGQSVDAVRLKRAWIEFNVPVGLLRVGRMPSHWGMGLLANGGGTAGCPGKGADPRQPGGCLDQYFDDDFGDNHFDSIADRVLFATRPLQVYRTLARHKDPRSNFVFAFAYDKLVEDYFNIPLEQHLRASRAFDQEPESGVPLGPASQRPFGEQAFLGRPDDDTQQWIFVLLYNDPDLDRYRLTDELRTGLYIVLRDQQKSRIVCASEPENNNAPTCPDEGPGDLVFTGDGSFVHIWDYWLRLRLDWFYTESEFYAILGSTDGGVPVGSQVTLEKDAKIFGLASRWGYQTESLDGLVEFGHASGDADIADATFTQRPVHPDYNVGLVLYEEVLREMTARTLGRLSGLGGYVFQSRSLQSNGGLINSWYVNPRVRYRPLDFVELVGGVLFAWWDEVGMLPAATVPVDPHGDPSGPARESEKFLGWEIDGALKVWWAENHLFWTLEAGYLRFGQGLRDAYPSYQATQEAPFLPGVDGAATVQSRIAFVF